MLNQLKKLEAALAHADVLNAKVSKANVAWHIDHSLRVIIGICTTLINSNPTEYKWEFSFWRTVIMFSGRMPRGKGKAPKAVVANDAITTQSITKQLTKAKQAIQQLDTLPANSFFKHPYFGLLNLKPSIEFLHLHTKHHLRIIDDIVKG